MSTNEKAEIGKAIQCAKSLLNSYAISHPEEIDLEAIAMAQDILVFTGELQGAKARLVRSGRRGGVIRVSYKLRTLGEYRFTVAHELGHWNLHTVSCQSNYCSDLDLRDYKFSKMEVEANYFASELLMPTSMFRPRCEDAEPNLETISELAEEFSTSLTATAVRFVEESKRYCLVIFSENGVVSWWRDAYDWRSADRKVWLSSGKVISEGTEAWKCFQQPSLILRNPMNPVDPRLWFSESEIKGDLKNLSVREQSAKLGNYPMVITLLWIFDEGESSQSRLHPPPAPLPSAHPVPGPPPATGGDGGRRWR